MTKSKSQVEIVKGWQLQTGAIYAVITPNDNRCIICQYDNRTICNKKWFKLLQELEPINDESNYRMIWLKDPHGIERRLYIILDNKYELKITRKKKKYLKK